MSKNKNRTPATETLHTPDNLIKDRWITDRAWICGVAGALTVVLCAYWYHKTNALQQGLHLFGVQLTDNRIDTSLVALLISTSVMILVEFARLWMRSPKDFWQRDPDVQSGQYFRFFVNSLFNYLLYLAMLGLVVAFFHSANEYGFQRNAPYYQPWFRFLDWVWQAYLWGGLPYVLITRWLKYNPQADQRDLAQLFTRSLRFLISLLPPARHMRTEFNEIDKKNARGLLVKLFFAPLMTVFFCDQFQHLVGNVGYVLNGLPDAIAAGQYTHARFNRDLFNISMALIFSIDVALAWCGYIIASRWLDNQTASAEPTMLGWVVCVICYPPFQNTLGLYFSVPSDRAVLGLDAQWLVSFFTVLMVASYVVYMSATLWFGVRFSNLTNRGIIRTGPFAFIRHPAYASKNFSWWCVMFPYIIFTAPQNGFGSVVFHTLGLLMMTGVYYLRAITEERHLMADPYYQAYCKQVKYRFIPGVI